MNCRIFNECGNCEKITRLMLLADMIANEKLKINSRIITEINSILIKNKILARFRTFQTFSVYISGNLFDYVKVSFSA